MKQLLSFLFALVAANYVMGQASSNTSAFPTGSGNTASTFVGVKSTRADGYKISVQGALKLWGTGNTLGAGNYSPTLMFDNRTATTGKKYYIQSTNEGNFVIVDSITGLPVRFIIGNNGNVGIGTSSPSALFHTVGSVRHDLGSDATGDIFYRNASGLFTRLPIGTNGQVLTVSSGIPAWGAGGGGGGGITSLNTLTVAAQTFATGNAGTDFGISSSGGTHTFNIPSAGAGSRGLLTPADWAAFNSKAPATGGTGYIQNGTSQQASANFNISGSGTIGSNMIVNGNHSVYGATMQLGSASQSGQVTMNFRQSSNASSGWNQGYTSFNNNDFYLYGYENAAYRIFTNATERLTVSAAGNVGVGTSSPSYKLDVVQSTSGDNGIRVQSGNSTNTIIARDSYGFEISANQTGQYINFLTGSQSRLLISGSGNIGVGTLSPSAKLDVAGTFKLADGTQGAGKVLTSDANGNTSWQTPSGGGGGQWTTSGNNIYNNNIGNVGIGNSNPANKLDVSGTTKLQGSSDAVQLTVQANATQTTDLIRAVNSAGNTVFRVTKDGNPVWVTPTYDAVVHPAASFQPTVGYDGTNVIWGNSSATHQISIGAIGNGYTAKPNIQFNGYSTVLNTTFGGTFTVVNPTGGFGSSSALVMAIKGTTGQTGNLMEWQNDGGTALSSVKSDGSVTIGTTNLPSGYKLAVGGNIIAEKVRVKLQSSGWPDYVFSNKYQLLTLPQTEAFIQQHKHLPGVPSAADVEKEGLDLGDGQAVLLKKIEELTLHLIEMNKKVEKLILENEALKKKIDQ